MQEQLEINWQFLLSQQIRSDTENSAFVESIDSNCKITSM